MRVRVSRSSWYTNTEQCVYTSSSRLLTVSLKALFLFYIYSTRFRVTSRDFASKPLTRRALSPQIPEHERAHKPRHTNTRSRTHARAVFRSRAGFHGCRTARCGSRSGRSTGKRLEPSTTCRGSRRSSLCAWRSMRSLTSSPSSRDSSTEENRYEHRDPFRVPIAQLSGADPDSARTRARSCVVSVCASERARACVFGCSYSVAMEEVEWQFVLKSNGKSFCNTI